MMPVNRLQHFVSQFVIRQFLGDRQCLYCLDKTNLSVVNRSSGNLPGDILKKAYYYTTDADDFDGEIVKPLEDKLAPICRGLVDAHEVTASGNGVWRDLVDWCALSLTRSIYFAHVAHIAYDTLPEGEKADLPPDQKAMTLVARRATFQRVQAEMIKSKVMFRFLKAPHEFGFYLTDHPPVPIPFDRDGAVGPLILPLAHDLMLIGVPMNLADSFFRATGQPTMQWLTLVQCGWARRLVYSADLDALDFAICILSGESPDIPDEMLRRARLPFFGFGQPSELASMWSAHNPETPSC